jgi:DNA gyrase/topoisomerase IV subunit A
MIELLEENNIERTISIIKNNSFENTVAALVNEYGMTKNNKPRMTSYQATQIANMKLNAFTKDSRDKYIEEKKRLEKTVEEIKEIIKSEKKIDRILLSELDDLRKYGRPRVSKIITLDNEEVISDTEHILVISKGAMMKKLPSPNRGYGTFKQGDYPVIRLKISNLDSVMMFDSFGRYSIIPVYRIKNTEYSDFGEKIYDSTKLDGEIVSAYQFLNNEVLETVNVLNEKMNLLCITRGGFIKKTPVTEFTTVDSVKNAKCIKLKENDNLVFAHVIFDSSNLLIYTKLGKFVYIKCGDVPELGRDSQGNLAIVLDEGDECIGCCVVAANAKYLVILTEKGYMKKCEIEYLGATRKRKDSSYLTQLDKNDYVFACEAITDKSSVAVCKRTDYVQLNPEDIPTLSRRSVPSKIIPLPVGDNIISMQIL